MTTVEDTAIFLTLSDFVFEDIDGDTLNRIYVTAVPASGTVTLFDVDITPGGYIDGIYLDSLKWQPAANTNGTGVATFVFQVAVFHEEGGWTEIATSPSTITFNVTAAPDAPVGNDDTDATTKYQATISGNVLTGAGEDGNADRIELTGVGNVTLNGFNATASSVELFFFDGKTLNGTGATDRFDFRALVGVGGTPSIDGKGGRDTIFGSFSSDRILGGADIDTLDGGAENDFLTGGAGANRFIYLAKADSTVAAAGRDTIVDFSQGRKDRIDLSAIDASTKPAATRSSASSPPRPSPRRRASSTTSRRVAIPSSRVT